MNRTLTSPFRLLALIGLMGMNVLAQPGDREAVPAYQALYEEGYYDEAITLLDSLLAADTSCNGELLRCLAFSHIARGDRETGTTVFGRMLDCDPSLRLDSLLTPPRILATFLTALELHMIQRPASDTLPPADDTVVSFRNTARPESTGAPGRSGQSDTVSAAFKKDTLKRSSTLPERSLLQAVPGVLPGGAGQFYQRKRVRGALVLGMQAVAVAGYVWAYRTRQSYYDPEHGWLQNNESIYNHYTAYTRLGCAVFIGAYSFSVIDYFSTVRKRRADR